jgi:hypothetical protein
MSHGEYGYEASQPIDILADEAEERAPFTQKKVAGKEPAKRFRPIEDDVEVDEDVLSEPVSIEGSDLEQDGDMEAHLSEGDFEVSGFRSREYWRHHWTDIDTRHGTN